MEEVWKEHWKNGRREKKEDGDRSRKRVNVVCLVLLFQVGWHNASDVPCLGDGRNILPTIHIRDLAA